MSETDVFARLREKIERNMSKRLASAADGKVDFQFLTADDNHRTVALGSANPYRCTTRGHVDAALGLLQRAAETMHTMQHRCDQLEASARQSADLAERNITARQADIAALQNRIAETETDINETTQRLAEAEFRAEQSERCAAEAQHWLNAFYQRILACLDETAELARPLYETKLAA